MVTGKATYHSMVDILIRSAENGSLVKQKDSFEINYETQRKKERFFS